MSTFAEPTQPVRYADVIASLPPPHSDETLAATIRAEVERSQRKVVVLDDDPTGPQAMGDVFVLTEWSVEALRRELREPRPLFFVLTNTRALPAGQAVALHKEVAANLHVAARQAGAAYTIVSRGDSTLRGHYPEEIEALGDFDATILVSFFEEGGRFTYDDVQWVREGEWLVPAAQTAYARDPMFGYQHSNLRNWVEEKSRGRIRAEEIISISVNTLRTERPDEISKILMGVRHRTIIVNAMSYRDLEVFTLGLLRAEATGQRFIVRSAASFLRVRAGGWNLEDERGKLDAGGKTPAANLRPPTAKGGLVIVGSYVTRSSAQLARLVATLPVQPCELRVSKIVAGRAEAEIQRVSQWIDTQLAAGHLAVVFTTRDVANQEGERGLALGQKISNAFVTLVRNLKLAPRFMVVKGGWTASEIGTQALGVKRAYAPAPILPGVPLWQLGAESRFPGVPYVIFPGNVGDERALVEAVQKLIDQIEV